MERPHLKYEQARQMRRDLTPPEARVWFRLKANPDGIHFRKQHPVGPYIADFYCAAAKLVIEVDGQVHNLPDVAAKDEIRQAYLESRGLTVLRITGGDIMADPDEVGLGVLLMAQGLIGKK